MLGELLLRKKLVTEDELINALVFDPEFRFQKNLPILRLTVGPNY